MIRLFNPAVIGMLMFLASVWWMLQDERDKSRPVLALAVIFNLFYGSMLSSVMEKADSLLPWKYDYYLYRVDGALGISTASVVLGLGESWRIPLYVVYQLLLPMMILWLAVLRPPERTALVFAYVAEMIAGPALYTILPACGPVYAFGSNWLHSQNVLLEAVRFSGMPNAFPSLHVATAFVLVSFASIRTWRALAVAFLAVTALATLTTGEHYVVDLVAGLSFGCFAVSAGRRALWAALGYLSITVGWSLAIRFGGGALVQSPAMLRFLALATVALSGWVAWSRWRVSQPVAPREAATAFCNQAAGCH